MRRIKDLECVSRPLRWRDALELRTRRSEALIKGASPVTEQVSAKPSQLVRLRENPFIPLIKARSLAANCNIEPNF
jgi:hypothetical protein